MLDFNTEPYNDDFDENNKFYRILFRPSFAVQARELTQMQSILQKQIEFNGSHIFKQGAMVIPGQSSLDVKYNYVKLQQTYDGQDIETYIDNLDGQTVTGQSSGVTATILKIVHIEGNDPTTLYVRYSNSGTDNQTKVFQDGEVLTTSDDNYSVLTAASDATGVGSSCTIERGVYYVNGYYVLCDQQTIILDKYSNKPSYRIGLLIDEQKITPEDNETLLDNAQNSYNYAAPGAHRYYIDLVLTKLPLYTSAKSWVSAQQFDFGDFIKSGSLYYKVTVGGLSGVTAPTATNDTTNGDLSLQYIGSYTEATDTSSDENFIQLITCSGGDVQKIINSTKYAEIEKNLATRTFDESGNYTVVPFKMDVREHRNNNRGAWVEGVSYLVGDVVTSSGYTYVAKTSDTSVGVGTPKVGPSHTSGDAYDGVSSSGVYWEYNETPAYNRGVYSPEDGGDEAKLALGMEPGSAYVQGYQVEKTAVEYVSINKARDHVQIADAYVSASVGNYVLVTNINSLPPFDDFSQVDLYDRFTSAVGVAAGSVVGTARVRGIEWHGGSIGSQTAIYKLFLFDVSLVSGKSFNRNVKAIFFDRSDANLNFSSDISPVTTLLRGTAYSGSIASPSSSETIIGNGTLFENDLSVDDYIYLDSTVRRVKTITADNQITVDGVITKTAANVTLLTTEIVQPQYATLLYPLGNYAVKSVRDSNNDTQIVYYTMEYCSAIAGSDLGSTCELVINVPNGGKFASGDETDNYIVVYNDSTSGGVIVSPISFSNGGNTSITITLPDTYAGKQMLVMATVVKTGADGREKTKSVNTTTSTYTTKIAATKNTLILGKADVYKIRSVKMDPTGTFGSPSGNYTIDITDRYDLDNGQRDTHYDLGRLILKHSYAAPSAPIRVEYDYFTHGTGDYFTVNSYTDIEYKDIPAYKGKNLRDLIDFRPRIDDTGTDFTGSGSSYSPSPKRGQDITVDYSYYLARKDKIGLDFQGNFFNIQGISSINPTDPQTPSTGMILYNLILEPYTFGTTTNNVVVNKVENKRYTMRDIGALEKRIENIEYYTALSLLEQDTKSLSIQDNNGLDRFKNGFIVDNFTGHGIGNADSPDYLCSIDMSNNVLRPFNVQKDVNLIEKNTNNTQRGSNNYKLYGDVITLPVLEDVVLAQNPYASRLENINPFAVFTFLGNVKLNPSSDDWFEVDRRPDIVHNIEGNYNTIAKLAEKAGVLGTVWNSWQDVWSGVPIVTGTRQTGWVGSSGGGSIPIWGTISNVETLATEVKQQRTGVTTTVTAKIDNQVVEDRILSTAIIPFVRKRNVLVQVKGLKPDTRFYGYFDGAAVSSYCTPSSYLTYTLTSGTDFDSSTNSGGNSTEDARLIQNVSGSFNSDAAGNMALNIGDVVSDSNGATAVVVGKDYDYETGARRLHVINIKGTFVIGHTITGSISGATGTVVSVPTNASQNDALTTNFNGDLNFLFWIENSDVLKFRTGTREFKLIDANTYHGAFTSSGRANYSATGILQTKQRTVNAVRNGEIVQQETSQSNTIYRTSERVVSSVDTIVGWYDPLAQTFLVQNRGGAFLSKVDVFFATKPEGTDAKLPVNLEIREVVNGYPGQTVLPFSRVTLKPEQVNISTTLVTLTDGSEAEYPSYDTPTTFTFPSPVYVQDNAEYAIVLSSDSNKYRAWISQMGDKIPASNRTISEQPYNGVLFKSQNASTWTADQNQDLKFTLWRARFDTSVIGDIKFHNDILPVKQLDLNPFETVAGTNKVRVWHRDHGLFDGSDVTLSNTVATVTSGTAATGTISLASTSGTTVTGTLFTTDIGAVGTSAAGTVLYKTDGTYIGVVASITSATSLELVANSAVAIASSSSYKLATPMNGIPVTEIYTSHTISDVDLDSFVITLTSDATQSGYGGGSTVNATFNIVYETVQPTVQVQTFPDTTLETYLNTTTGKSVDGSEVPYINYSPNVDSNYNTVTLNDNNYYYYPCVIASQENEDNSALSGAKSVTLKCKISSTNDALSPIIDTHRTSLKLVSNKLNNPSETNINVSELDDRLLFTSNFTFSGSTITSTNSGVRDLMKTIVIGKYITIDTATTPGNDGTYLVTGLSDNGSTGTITIDGTFAANEAAGASTTLTLRNLFVDEIGPTGGSVINKYVSKVINLANPSTFLRITFASYVPSQSDVLVYYKTSPVASTLDFEQTPWTLLDPDSAIVKSELNSTDMPLTDNDFTAQDLAQFDAFAVKLVMVSTNSAAAPMIKDLRIIACA